MNRLAFSLPLIGPLSLAIAGEAPSSIPAFPGAEGAGALITGGRGGQVVHVTNLHPAGPGSLAAAVSESNRIVVFDVSGVIDITGVGGRKNGGGRIAVTGSNITIAGQTAPGEGICIKGGCLEISGQNVIVRYVRSRRGFVHDTDTGDAIEVKPVSIGEATEAKGQTTEAFDKRKAKKLSRGKYVHEFAPMAGIIIDHCSTSWATDENLTVTHADGTTVSWSIAAEGCDYTNSKQTPPNHSEGSLWGSGAPDGRSTMHHMLYAHNRLRNPRTTGGPDQPPILSFYNNVVYDWSEYASHTGTERVLLNWLNSYYRPGPSTPPEIRTHFFQFHGDPGARIFARGNFVPEAPEVNAENKLGISHNEKFRKVPEVDREAMKVDAPFGEIPANIETAEQAFTSVLDGVGATLPSRDAVDLRIVNSVRTGTGKVIEKETDLPESERWPDYRTLPAPKDTDGDGLPDFWEQQFGLNPADPADAARLGAGGYANIEHYFNNTAPTAGPARPIVSIAATISRAKLAAKQEGEWLFTRTGPTAEPLTVTYEVAGDAKPSRDYAPLTGVITFPAGASTATLHLSALPTAEDDHTVTITLHPGATGYHVGCPAASLVVIRR